MSLFVQMQRVPQVEVLSLGVHVKGGKHLKTNRSWTCWGRDGSDTYSGESGIARAGEFAIYF